MLSSTGMRSETQGPQRLHLRKSSRKAPAVKTAIIAKRAVGESKTQIARDLNISKNTVASIIELSNIDRMLEDGKVQAHKLIPKSVTTIDLKLDKGDLDAAKFILSNTIFSERSEDRRTIPDTTVSSALNVYIDNKVITPDTDSNKIVDPQK